MDQGLSPQESRDKRVRAVWETANREGLQTSSGIAVPSLCTIGIPKGYAVDQEEIQAFETL